MYYFDITLLALTFWSILSTVILEEWKPQNYIEDNSFVALLDVVYTDNTKRTCTGSIIHDFVVLSAANCFRIKKVEITLSFVVIGTKKMFKEGYEKYLPIEKILVHPEYNGYTANLALIYTFATMTSDKPGKVIGIFSDINSNPFDAYVTVLSWGRCKDDELEDGKFSIKKTEDINSQTNQNWLSKFVFSIGEITALGMGRNKDVVQGKNKTELKRVLRIEPDKQKKQIGEQSELTTYLLIEHSSKPPVEQSSESPLEPTPQQLLSSELSELSEEKVSEELPPSKPLPEISPELRSELLQEQPLTPSPEILYSRQLAKRRGSTYHPTIFHHPLPPISEARESRAGPPRAGQGSDVEVHHKRHLRVGESDYILRTPSRHIRKGFTANKIHDYRETYMFSTPKTFSRNGNYYVSDRQEYGVIFGNGRRKNGHRYEEFGHNLPDSRRGLHMLMNSPQQASEDSVYYYKLKPGENQLITFYKNWRRNLGTQNNLLAAEIFTIINMNQCIKILNTSFPELVKQNANDYICYFSEDHYVTDEDWGAPAVHNGKIMAVTVDGATCDNERVAVGIKMSCYCNWIKENLPSGGTDLKCCIDCCNPVEPAVAISKIAGQSLRHHNSYEQFLDEKPVARSQFRLTAKSDETSGVKEKVIYEDQPKENVNVNE